MEGSPYTPGAGHMPPMLAGRDEQRHAWAITLNDVSAVGRTRSTDVVLTGPRGIGKTATLSALARMAETSGFAVLSLQAVAGGDLMTSLREEATERATLATQSPWSRLRDALNRIAGVSASLPGGAGASLTIHPAPAHPAPATGASAVARALADLAADLRKADDGRGGLMLSVDELQVARPQDLTLLAGVLHRLNVSHPDARIVFAGTGLPTVQQTMENAGVTHPDRLFTFDRLPVTLTADQAALAVVEPARQRGVVWEPAALDALITTTNAYPAHLQLFADRTWQTADNATISHHDFTRAAPDVLYHLVEQTLGPRWERLTGRDRAYLAALALLGGQSRSSAVAGVLGQTSVQLSDVRDRLIKSGDLYAPRYGITALSMPLLGPYVLAGYEEARLDTQDEYMQPLAELQRRAEQIRHNPDAAASNKYPLDTSIDHIRRQVDAEHRRRLDYPGPAPADATDPTIGQ